MKPYYQNELTTIYNGDCLEVMDYLIDQGIKVDAIITDPPYGTTACSWDTIIPFDKMWERLNKLRKDKTPVVLFGSEPFSSHLRMSNIKEFKYDWIWEKSRGANFLNANNSPLKKHEIITTFYNHNYYPILHKLSFPKYDKRKEINFDVKTNNKMTYEELEKYCVDNKNEIIQNNPTIVDVYMENGYFVRKYGYRNPSSIIKNDSSNNNSLHPTQKPIALLQYLIKTYTKENDLILDFTAGSFTTCVAAEQLNRRSIGIELEKKYCDIGIKRLNNLQLKFDI